MASREKRPLAPSKTKQKANNDSSLLPGSADSSSSTSSRSFSNKSKKSLQSSPHAQVARELFDSVSTGSQLPAKLEASLPRKRVLQTALKRKQKAKKTIIKVKQKVPIKSLKRIADAKKILNRKKKAVKSASVNYAEISVESEDTKNKCKTSKKLRTSAKASEEIESESQDKSSPKLGKKVVDSLPKNIKGGRTTTAQKRNDSKERVDPKIKRSLSKEPEEVKIKTEPVDNSYEVTIEEVIASSMLVEQPIEVEGEESASEGELKGKKNLKNPTVKRSLRNGKLRQTLPKIDPDSEPKRTPSMSEPSVEQLVTEAKPIGDAVSDVISVKSEATSEDTTSTAAVNHVNDSTSSSESVETNNNGCDQGAEEIGPTLRSKTKARSGSEVRSIEGGDVKSEDTSSNKLLLAVKSDMEAVKKDRGLTKFTEIKSSVSVGVNNAIKSRRSSLNIDTRRSSLYSNERMSDGASKSQIDEMIDQIKLTIAKSIESRTIYKPDAKGMIIGKIEVPNIEEIIAPLSNDTKSKLENNADEEKPNVSNSKELITAGIGSLSKKEMKSEDEENSVPKVADTAKEIEKLVMGESEPAESQPTKEKDVQLAEDAVAASAEIVDVAVQEEKKTNTDAVFEDDKVAVQSTSNENFDNSGKDSSVKQCDEMKKPSSACPTRKSTRTTAGKSSLSSQELKKCTNEELDNISTESNKEKNLDVIDKKEDDKSEGEETTNKASNIENNEGAKENKTILEMEASAEPLKDTEALAPEVTCENEKMEIEESIEPEKNEETLESLSREVERLVEEDNNEKVAAKLADNDKENEVSSDVEMQLMIDEEAPESVVGEMESQTQNNKNEDGCDQKNASIGPEEVQNVEDIVTQSISVVQENSESGDATTTKSATNDDKSKTTEVEVQKETRRILRARTDKGRKSESTKVNASVPVTAVQDKSETKVKLENAAASEVPLDDAQNSKTDTGIIGVHSQVPAKESTETNEITPVVKIETEEQREPQIRTRRSREVKKQPPPQPPKAKRGAKKQESKKIDHQQNKEETMLDNEVAEINENDRFSAYIKTGENRGVSADADNSKQQKPETESRSKSENDVQSTNLSDDIMKAGDKILSTVVETEECKEDTSKDSDEASTSGESSSSVEKIFETPEDRAKKEDILRQLGLESWEKAKERTAKKEQEYTGTLKTVIRLQKEKEGKKRSRSPLKMVLKQQGRMDGEESSEFYTIQKELGSSGLGDSSSDEDNEDGSKIVKNKEPLVIPEKSSSFSIHPGRLCADNCCYCHGKFGSLDTPMHLAQIKSDARRKKILENEVHLTKDSCLCDACYRHVDRKANNSPTNVQIKPPKKLNRQSIMRCMIRGCGESSRHHVKRRWLLKIKQNLKNAVDVNWDSTNSLMTFCNTHFSKIERYLMCTLCKRHLTRNSSFPLGLTSKEVDDMNKSLRQQGIPATMVANTFFCKPCKYFAKIHTGAEPVRDHSRDYYKKYRKKLLYFYGVNSEKETNSSVKNKGKNRRVNNNSTKSKGKASVKRSSKSPENSETPSASTSEKSTPEPPKTDLSEMETSAKEESTTLTNTDSRYLGIEGAIEKLKKRKALDTSTHSSRSLLNDSTNNVNARDIVEIVAMDEEVTLMKLPKRPRIANNTSTPNDITPVVQRLGANPSISVRTLFPGEEEMNLHATIEFNNVREMTPRGWEKCATIIQYDRDTKQLWQELQRPYGNQSSFLRHLILLEKYYRAGDLILAPNASRNAINYSTSVQNRLISYEGPEKPEESVMESSNAIECNNSRRLSGGYVMERDHRTAGTSSSKGTSNFANVTSQLSKLEPSSRAMKLAPGVSIIKKPPPNLQRLNLNTGGGINGSAKRKECVPMQKGSNANSNMTGGKVFQLTEPDFKRLQSLKRQKQMMNERPSPNSASGSSSSTQTNYKTATTIAQFQKTQQMISQSQFQKHLRMQQEMLNQRSRGDFEPLICDIRLPNENTPTQNLIINNLNLPKSIQVTTKGPASASQMPIPILPKIPKSLTVIPQTVARIQEK